MSIYKDIAIGARRAVNSTSAKSVSDADKSDRRDGRAPGFPKE